ncbi:2-hydroxyacid dehydrogenase [Athalassotoga saccharophila]|uniref:2-hydroxyacid dehydrogenase n=1 Tax=Athalassotoga saccharophila TaxID=1441386 RepID=UPI00137A1C72|nr:2-hydroxyacid dehydrogenase [Athalassotoga saccharophila]BBJ27455.1 D-3-phosphoglycerate dehydrogenase [Athalassotoga saccharophila]
MKIVFFDIPEKSWVKKIENLKKEFKDALFISNGDLEEIKDADGIVGGHISSEMISKAKNLKVIFVPWAGVNTLPWDEIKKRNVMVSNNHANAKIVAERALALALAVMGRVVEYHNDLSRGIWHGFSAGDPQSAFWTSIRGKTCGIIGVGSIGQEIAKLVKAFDCKVIGFKKRKIEKIDFIDEITLNLEEAVSKSDVIFVTLPLTPQTRGIINEKIISLMIGKFLINVSRGPVIDEKALYEGIRTKTLRGVAIDTWYRYPDEKNIATLPSAYPIHDFKNVVISPHVGSLTYEGVEEMINATIENVRSYLKNGRPLDIVDPELMY